MATKMPAVGIDLGTGYSCIGVWENGKAELICSGPGKPFTPSYVAFTKDEILVGEAAKEQAAMNPRNTVFGVKTIMGREYDDRVVQDSLRHWPFKVIDDSNKPKIQVEYKGETKEISPIFVTSMLLAHMKKTAEAYTGSPVQDAVITVPPHFTPSQREATLDAAYSAGLRVLKIMDESIAAAVALMNEKSLEGQRYLLVLDLGSGSFDVSVIAVNGESDIEVKSSVGGNVLSGKDFDNKLMKYLCKCFKRKYKKKIKKNAHALSSLRLAAEKAKDWLSTNDKMPIDIEVFFEGIKLHTKLSRERFEELCSDLFLDTLVLVKTALEDAKLHKNMIDSLVLLGGCGQIPRIRTILLNFFKRSKHMTTFFTHEKITVYGAALQASNLSQTRDSMKRNEVAPLSLGIDTTGGVMERIIERNAEIPCTQSQMFTTQCDNQTAITVEVFEGERLLTKDNNLLGSFVLHGIPPGPRGGPKIEITFSIETNGVLHVSAKETSTGISKDIRIENCLGHHSKDEIDRIVKEAEEYKIRDTAQIERIDMINQFEAYIFSVKKAINEVRNLVNEKCEEAMGWVRNNVFASGDEYHRRLLDLQIDCTSSMSQMIHTSAGSACNCFLCVYSESVGLEGMTESNK